MIWDLETHLWALPHSGVIKALQALHWLHKLSRFSGVGVRASPKKKKKKVLRYWKRVKAWREALAIFHQS